MLTVARHSLPWTRLAAAVVMLAILLEGVRRWSWLVWPLEGVAVGLLAAAVAWCLDEPAGTVVDAVPRSLWWRTAARSVGIAALVAAWSLGVWWARDGMFGHPWAVWVQGLAGGAVGASWATWRRAVGVRSPGIAFAAVVVPIAALWAVLRPFARDFPVFPYAYEGDGDWAASTTGWVAVGAMASVGLALVLADSRWWRIGRGIALRRTSGWTRVSGPRTFGARAAAQNPEQSRP